ncbi:MAG: ABC transporter ATP-binding protein [Gallionella sp.]|jgi:putative ABC transport system ATP-binding protein|nr:ABC transporter ATP-binding protein [Gallionella sp.]MCK9352822.1 ABC transporter ATP-binding protein [Gallionella sp.]
MTISSPSPQAPILSTRNLSLHFDEGQTRALDGVDIEIVEGEFVAITGPSGCGKSSLLNLIGTLDIPTSGDIHFRSRPYSALGDLSLFRRENIGFIFQSFYLLPTLSALDNVLVPTIGRSGDHEERARALLTRLGLSNRLDHFPGKLSGGERQRVAIARALINDPDLILADEPTGSLDSANAAQVLDLLDCLRREKELTIIMVTHDANVSARADRVIPMRDGKVDAEVAA